MLIYSMNARSVWTLFLTVLLSDCGNTEQNDFKKQVHELKPVQTTYIPESCKDPMYAIFSNSGQFIYYGGLDTIYSYDVKRRALLGKSFYAIMDEVPKEVALETHNINNITFRRDINSDNVLLIVTNASASIATFIILNQNLKILLSHTYSFQKYGHIVATSWNSSIRRESFSRSDSNFTLGQAWTSSALVISDYSERIITSGYNSRTTDEIFDYTSGEIYTVRESKKNTVNGLDSSCIYCATNETGCFPLSARTLKLLWNTRGYIAIQKSHEDTFSTKGKGSAVFIYDKKTKRHRLCIINLDDCSVFEYSRGLITMRKNRIEYYDFYNDN